MFRKLFIVLVSIFSFSLVSAQDMSELTQEEITELFEYINDSENEGCVTKKVCTSSPNCKYICLGVTSGFAKIWDILLLGTGYWIKGSINQECNTLCVNTQGCKYVQDCSLNNYGKNG